MTSSPGPDRFLGKHRGEVLDNEDPLALGRLLVSVASVPGAVLNWALPCIPYAGPQLGFCMAPPIGASIWVEFEGGDPNYPIWTGCFWQEGERPAQAARPSSHLIQTACTSLQFDDAPGGDGVTLRVRAPASATPVTIGVASSGIIELVARDVRLEIDETCLRLTAPPAKIVVTPEGITIAHGNTAITLVEPMVTIEASVLSAPAALD